MLVNRGKRKTTKKQKSIILQTALTASADFRETMWKPGELKTNLMIWIKHTSLDNKTIKYTEEKGTQHDRRRESKAIAMNHKKTEYKASR